MSKKIIFPYLPFEEFVEEPLLKRLSLFYDEILINEGRLNLNQSKINLAKLEALKKGEIFSNYGKATIDFLIQKNVIKTYPKFSEQSEPSPGIRELGLLLQNNIMKFKEKKMSEPNLKTQIHNAYYSSHDIIARIDSLRFRENDNLSEYYPLLRNYETLRTESKKNQVIQFVLNDIPEPDLTTSWEQIIEYRSDENIKNKYLALINWINKTANSNLKLSEIKDEYDYLYSEYMTQFKLHKMKYNNSSLEVIVNSTINFINNLQTGNYISSIKDLFQFKLKNAKLSLEESKLSGKEIAYIYHTKSKFLK